MKDKVNRQLIIPFSDAFAETWGIWKEYKWASHNFKYKSIFSEQAALEQLVTLSGGDEEKAVKIIKQSMRREWQGLFPLNETTSENGKSASKKQSGSTKQPEQSVADSFKAAFIRNNGGGGQEGTGDHLKAV